MRRTRDAKDTRCEGHGGAGRQRYVFEWSLRCTLPSSARHSSVTSMNEMCWWLSAHDAIARCMAA
eukprot:5295756-Prymnesium_polylepis.1